MTKGRMRYTPGELEEELNFYKLNDNLHRDSEAMRKMIEDCRIGREIRINMFKAVNFANMLNRRKK